MKKLALALSALAMSSPAMAGLTLSCNDGMGTQSVDLGIHSSGIETDHHLFKLGLFNRHNGGGIMDLNLFKGHHFNPLNISFFNSAISSDSGQAQAQGKGKGCEQAQIQVQAPACQEQAQTQTQAQVQQIQVQAPVCQEQTQTQAQAQQIQVQAPVCQEQAQTQAQTQACQEQTQTQAQDQSQTQEQLEQQIGQAQAQAQAQGVGSATVTFTTHKHGKIGKFFHGIRHHSHQAITVMPGESKSAIVKTADGKTLDCNFSWN